MSSEGFLSDIGILKKLHYSATVSKTVFFGVLKCCGVGVDGLVYILNIVWRFLTPTGEAYYVNSTFEINLFYLGIY